MTEREVLKLALEALEVNLGTWSAKKKAIPAIKEALAQPDPVPYWHSEFLKHNTTSGQLAQQQEPVAWRWGVPKLKNGDFEWRYSLNQTRPDAIPLYTTPPQTEPVIDKSAAIRIATALGWEPKRKPLTEPELHAINPTWPAPGQEWGYEEVLAFARAIEAAHGIKEKNT